MGSVKHQNDIRFHRVLNELSIRQFAQKIGKDPESLSLIERGLRSPTLETAWEIADFFGVPLTELFFREGDVIAPKTFVRSKRGGSLRGSMEVVKDGSGE